MQTTDGISLAFTPDPAPAAAFALAAQAMEQGARALILLAADGNGCTPGHFDAWLRRLPVPVCGGVFPQLIHDQRNHECGYIVVGLPVAVAVTHIAGLSDPRADYAAALAGQLDTTQEHPGLLVLVDGLSSRIAAFLDGLYDTLGSDPAYFGGGAGSLSFEQAPCLFSNQGMLHDHAQLVGLPWQLDLAVEHGWEKFAGPFVVTGANRNVIETLDYRPAFEVYRACVQADSGRSFATSDFFEIARGYPFGMEKPDGEMIVRDPITHTGEAINCVGEVPVNSIVHVLKGRPERLIAAAAASAARLPAGDGPAILVDCISRVLFLEGDFIKELQAVKRPLGPRPLFGVLTLGEIANGGDLCLEFYNKTLVLAALRS